MHHNTYIIKGFIAWLNFVLVMVYLPQENDSNTFYLPLIIDLIEECVVLSAHVL